MPGHAEFRDLLARYNEFPAARDETLERIRKDFGRRVAVLILDTCGFSRTVEARGIVPFLALFERIDRVVRPAIHEADGHVLRRDADDVFAYFATPADALRGARLMLKAIDAANIALPHDEEVGVSIGIGYGELLMVGDDDAWGDEMNLACKLGEDIAGHDEVLLTAAAYAALGETEDRFERKVFQVSGIEIVAYKLLS